MNRRSAKICIGLISMAVILTIPLVFFPHTVLAVGYTFTPIPLEPQAINDSGDIVGWYTDSAGAHGYLYSGGNVTTIDVPGATNTQAQGINNRGDIVGNYSGYPGGAFLYAGGDFTTISVPGSYHTTAYGINDSGHIVGWYMDRPHDTQHVYLYKGGKFTTIDALDAIGPIPRGINNRGDIVGFYVDSGGAAQGFLYAGGDFTTISVPGAFPHHYGGTIAYGINDRGDIVGYYVDTGGIHGLLYAKGKFTTIDAPGTTNTQFDGINDRGDIVGSSGGTIRNFVATRVPEPSTILLLGSGLAGLWGFRRKFRK